MSDNTLNKALQIMGSDIGAGGDQRRRGYRLTASSLLNGGLPHDTEKKAPSARRGGAAQGRPEQDPSIYGRAAYWAERVRLMQHCSNRLDAREVHLRAVSLGCSEWNDRKLWD
ncbi:hypothetical protein RX327_35595 [Bradyrhizobium sp. BEA-2-5]|uniref:hypothetical protein n=1 Tax=Bradyrhizobium TaxID=374 RepID=UPI00128EABAD|nr:MULTISPECIES: hypothetical protein [Bradyrhizobium]WOH81002.1 hypothetical protein RX327_35595 [Bradyrhizobium sp. BEA-2-5]